MYPLVELFLKHTLGMYLKKSMVRQDHTVPEGGNPLHLVMHIT